jgi:transposase
MHSGMYVSKGHHESMASGYVRDIEWNAFDLWHRVYVHHTYPDFLKVFSGKHFSVNVTRWGRLPIFIQVANAWIKRGVKKEVPTNSGRQRINLNGAMNAHQPDDVEVVEAEIINAQATRELLEKLLKKNIDKERIYVLGDNARYYTNRELKEWLEQNPKIQLLHIPPYSPNLNLIERLWKFMRKKIINLHYYPTFEEFRKAIHDFFAQLKQYKEELIDNCTFIRYRLLIFS